MKKLLLLATLSACVQPKVDSPVEVVKPKGFDSEKVIAIVKASKCTSYSWQNRGKAPLGYVKGMALLYAKHVCTPGPVTAAMKKEYGPADKDALTHYGLRDDKLRDLFTLAIGLGMRESSGKYCCGLDRSASNTRHDTAEAGTFQTSFGARLTNPELPKLFAKYRGDRSECLLDVFKEGVSDSYCSGANSLNYGTGDGLEYQKLSKSCPAFAAEFTLVAMRSLRKHWGPLNRLEAEIKQECSAMLKEIESTCQ